jgi:hypothetical protein
MATQILLELSSSGRGVDKGLCPPSLKGGAASNIFGGEGGFFFISFRSSPSGEDLDEGGDIK